jgi:hypothetical protein
VSAKERIEAIVGIEVVPGPLPMGSYGPDEMSQVIRHVQELERTVSALRRALVAAAGEIDDLAARLDQ